MAVEDVPALGFAVGAVEQPHGGGLIRVHLHGQALCAVNELGQHAKGCIGTARAKVACGVALQHGLQGHVCAAQAAHALFRELLAPGIAGRNNGEDPFFRKMAIPFRGHTVEAVQHGTAQIGAPCARVIEQKRKIRGRHRHKVKPPVQSAKPALPEWERRALLQAIDWKKKEMWELRLEELPFPFAAAAYAP